MGATGVVGFNGTIIGPRMGVTIDLIGMFNGVVGVGCSICGVGGVASNLISVDGGVLEKVSDFIFSYLKALLGDGVS